MYNKQKTGGIIIALLALTGCATTTQPIIAQPSTSSRVINPATETEVFLTEQETAQQEAESKEEETYNSSLDKINATFNSEYQQYQTCLVINPKPDNCLTQLKQVCKIDTLIDSRGGHHNKPYCDTKFLESQKHSKTHN